MSEQASSPVDSRVGAAQHRTGMAKFRRGIRQFHLFQFRGDLARRGCTTTHFRESTGGVCEQTTHWRGYCGKYDEERER